VLEIHDLTWRRDSGVNAIESLMERSGAFDYILLETSGLADPGNIAPLFWVDEGLGSSIYLDGIVTLVDARNILKSLEEQGKLPPDENEKDHQLDLHETLAHRQISHADILVLNKADTVSPGDLQNVIDRIRGINALARLETTTYSQVPSLEGVVLDLHAYDNVKTLNTTSKAHSHIDPVSDWLRRSSVSALMHIDDFHGYSQYPCATGASIDTIG
jgi:G3E family GTPase